VPIVVEERFESRSTVKGKSPSVELRYWIKGTDDDIAARGALESAAPTEYDGLVRQDVQIEPQGHELWDGRVRYAVPSFGGLPTGESVFSFDTGGGTRHITQSRQTILRKAPSGQTAPDFKGADLPLKSWPSPSESFGVQGAQGALDEAEASRNGRGDSQAA